MAYDEGLAQLMRDELAEEPFAEKKMFGGLCFLLHGNMVCGVHKGGAMFRVGKPNDAAARAIEGVGPMLFTGKAMQGFVECDDAVMVDDARRDTLIALSLGYAKSLPPK
jgi:hypothetical protein